MNGEEVQVRAATTGELEDLIRQRLEAKYLPLVLDFAGIDLVFEDRDTSLQRLGLVDDAIVTATVQDDAETKQIAMEAQEWEEKVEDLENIVGLVDGHLLQRFFGWEWSQYRPNYSLGYATNKAFPLMIQADKMERQLGGNARFKHFRQRLLDDWESKVKEVLDPRRKQYRRDAYSLGGIDKYQPMEVDGDG